MSLNPQVIDGGIVVALRLEAKPGKADEVAQWMANLKARVDVGLEPGTLKYNFVRFGNSFSAWEEYADIKAMKSHTEDNPLFQEFSKVKGDLFESFAPLFWPANSLPEPTIRP